MALRTPITPPKHYSITPFSSETSRDGVRETLGITTDAIFFSQMDLPQEIQFGGQPRLAASRRESKIPSSSQGGKVAMVVLGRLSHQCQEHRI